MKLINSFKRWVLILLVFVGIANAVVYYYYTTNVPVNISSEEANSIRIVKCKTQGEFYDKCAYHAGLFYWQHLPVGAYIKKVLGVKNFRIVGIAFTDTPTVVYYIVVIK